MRSKEWIAGIGTCLVAVVGLSVGLGVNVGLAIAIGTGLALPTVAVVHHASARTDRPNRRAAVAVFVALALGSVSLGVALLWQSRPMLAAVTLFSGACFGACAAIVLSSSEREGDAER